MKTKRLALISSLAVTVLIASPVLGAPKKKSVTSHSRAQRVTPRTTQVTPAYQRGTTRQYAGTQRYVGTRQYSGGRYYTQNRYASRGYYGGPSYYYGGSGYPNYGYYSSWPSASYGYYPNSYYGGYPNSYYGGYPYSYYGGYRSSYSYYQPGYLNDDATVAAVQRRLGELGYYHGSVDAVIGPQTRAAIAVFQSRHGMVVDGMITTRLLDRMGLA